MESACGRFSASPPREKRVAAASQPRRSRVVVVFEEMVETSTADASLHNAGAALFEPSVPIVSPSPQCYNAVAFTASRLTLRLAPKETTDTIFSVFFPGCYGPSDGATAPRALG